MPIQVKTFFQLIVFLPMNESSTAKSYDPLLLLTLGQVRPNVIVTQLGFKLNAASDRHNQLEFVTKYVFCRENLNINWTV